MMAKYKIFFYNDSYDVIAEEATDDVPAAVKIVQHHKDAHAWCWKRQNGTTVGSGEYKDTNTDE